jgi:uncharacterized protein (DUF342 family)
MTTTDPGQPKTPKEEPPPTQDEILQWLRQHGCITGEEETSLAKEDIKRRFQTLQTVKFGPSVPREDQLRFLQ